MMAVLVVGDPDRLRAIGRRNTQQAALRHDWLHRIQKVFDILGIAATEKMQARSRRLDQIALQSDKLPAL